MKIKELSRLTGLTEKTIRYYETKELIAPEKKRQGGRDFRDYSDDDAKELIAIATLRKAALTIEEIHLLQTDPGYVQMIVNSRKEKLAASQAQTAGLLRAFEQMQDAMPENIYELAERISGATEKIELPKRDVNPNFGRFDDITDEQRQQEYELHTQRMNERLSSSRIAITVLSAVCIVLVACLIVSLRSLAGKIPEPSGNSDGYVFYMNGIYLCRSLPDGSEQAQIYKFQNTNDCAFTVEYDKIYAIDYGTAISMNIDGSGVKRIATDVYPMGDKIVYYDGYLYYRLSTGMLTSTYRLGRTRVNGLGGKDKLDIQCSGSFTICDGYVFSTDGEINAYEIESRQLITLELDNVDKINTVLANGMMFIFSGNLVSVYRFEDGNPVLLKEYPLEMQDTHLESSIYASSLVTAGDMVYFERFAASSSQISYIEIYGLDLSTGELVLIATVDYVSHLYAYPGGIVITTPNSVTTFPR